MLSTGIQLSTFARTSLERVVGKFEERAAIQGSRSRGAQTDIRKVGVQPEMEIKILSDPN
jgi:hypothetical protein